MHCTHTHTYYTHTTQTLYRPPICGLADNACLVLPAAEKNYPEVSFRAEAAGFSGPNALTYEFGFITVEGGEQILQVRECSSNRLQERLRPCQMLLEVQLFAKVMPALSLTHTHT